MAQDNYSLEEAAKFLGMAPQELTQMAQRKEIRSAQVEGKLTFRPQDVEELARARGLGSDEAIPIFDSSSILDDDEVVLLDDSSLSGVRLNAVDTNAPTVIGMRSGPISADSDIRLIVKEGRDSSGKIDSSDPKEPSEAINLDDSDSMRAPSDSDVRLTFEDSGINLGVAPKPASSIDLGRTEELDLSGDISDVALVSGIPDLSGLSSHLSGISGSHVMSDDSAKSDIFEADDDLGTVFTLGDPSSTKLHKAPGVKPTDSGIHLDAGSTLGTGGSQASHMTGSTPSMTTGSSIHLDAGSNIGGSHIDLAGGGGSNLIASPGSSAAPPSGKSGSNLLDAGSGLGSSIFGDDHSDVMLGSASDIVTLPSTPPKRTPTPPPKPKTPTPMPKAKTPQPQAKTPPPAKHDEHSDIDLGGEGSDFDLNLDSGVNLGGEFSLDSGINLGSGAHLDSGVSLDEPLSQSGSSTPKMGSSGVKSPSSRSGIKSGSGVKPPSGTKPGSGVKPPSGAKSPSGVKLSPSGIKATGSGVGKGAIESPSSSNEFSIDSGSDHSISMEEKSESSSEFNFDFDDAEGFKLVDAPKSPAFTAFDQTETVSTKDEGSSEEIDLDKTTAISLHEASDIGLADEDSDITAGSAADSGINLARPDDSGISLEEQTSDSEFELSLDSDAEGDIFATDELPAFRDDSDVKKKDKTPPPTKVTPVKAAAGLIDETEETEVSSDSDFELALDDEFEVEEESGSEVVAVDEDEAAVEDEMDAAEEFGDEMAPAGEEAPVARVRTIAAPSVDAPWPKWAMFPLAMTTLMLMICGIMTYEVLRNAWSYNTPYTFSGPLIDVFNDMAKAIGIGKS